ncbi:WXG100 family type VII secretion target [Micromonospora polyrhachis]|uniref:ESAT-6-like protein n=1 Tax=Micromonospora polyrhachis TaxID=1282883 RepID=A0A7W7SPG9_9ACTN|nr:WXG100 family type VII secretion target [Micromonospora polyrhachis]MBB4958528.1 WXG100 family type VII secretion target [Micromonospora polyrhachis]
MSDQLVVKLPALEKASGDIQRALNTLDAQLSQLEQDAGPLVASWEGDAQQAYAERQARWRSASNDLKTMLRDIKLAVDESVLEYRSTEKRNTQLFSG